MKAVLRPALALLAGAFASGAAGCDESQVVHKLEPSLERMMDQPRGDPFSPSAAFENGQTMRIPPEGTVPRGEVAPAYRDDGGFVATIPYPVDRPMLVRGEALFEVSCAACHGILGDGDSVVASKMPLRRPPSLHDPRIAGLRPGELEEIVENGYGFMPSYAEMFPRAEDRWAIVAYLGALQLSQGARVAKLPADVQRELAHEAP